MEIPFNYIFFLAMIMLKQRKRKTKISEKDLMNFINNILSKMTLNKDALEELRNNFDYEFERDKLITDYFEYIDFNDGIISLDNDISYEEIEYFLEISKENAIGTIFENIEDLILDDTSFLDILNIKVKKDLYDKLISLEEKISYSYDELYLSSVSNDQNEKQAVLKEIKKLLFTKRLTLFNMLNILSLQEYEDLVNYGKEICERERQFLFNENHKEITKESLDRTIFIGEDNEYFYVLDSLEKKCISKEENSMNISFYTLFLDNLEEEINNTKNDSIIYFLKETKYRIINGLDSMYEMNLFLNDNDKYYNKDISNDNYDMFKDKVHFLIDELLSFPDYAYTANNYEDANLLIMCEAIIRKIYIKTYYMLTHDKMVEYNIRNNINYKVNKISSSMLDEIIEKSKIRERENK